jgi:prepilin-type N-terminal cleavage/methylation domain-containing protein
MYNSFNSKDMLQKAKSPKNKGFTLIELLVVISIISLLSTIVLASLNTARDKARNTYVVQSVNAYITAIKLFYSENGYYPSPAGLTWYCLGRDFPTTCLDTLGAENAILKAQLQPYIQWVDPSPYTTDSMYVSGALVNCTIFQFGKCKRISLYWVINSDQLCVLSGAQYSNGLCILTLES